MEFLEAHINYQYEALNGIYLTLHLLLVCFYLVAPSPAAVFAAWIILFVYTVFLISITRLD